MDWMDEGRGRREIRILMLPILVKGMVKGGDLGLTYLFIHLAKPSLGRRVGLYSGGFSIFFSDFFPIFHTIFETGCLLLDSKKKRRTKNEGKKERKKR